MNSSRYSEDSSYSSQNVGYSGRPLPQQRDQHAPLSNQNFQQMSNQFDAANSSESVADRNNGPPSSNSTPSADSRTNGSGSGSLDLPSGSKRLHVSNIPFRFRENDLHAVFAVSYCTVHVIVLVTFCILF